MSCKKLYISTESKKASTKSQVSQQTSTDRHRLAVDTVNSRSMGERKMPRVEKPHGGSKWTVKWIYSRLWKKGPLVCLGCIGGWYPTQFYRDYIGIIDYRGYIGDEICVGICFINNSRVGCCFGNGRLDFQRKDVGTNMWSLWPVDPCFFAVVLGEKSYPAIERL